MFPVEITTHPAFRLAAIAHTGPYTGISRAFATLGDLMASRNLQGQAQGMVAVYYDDPAVVPVAELRAHAAVIVDGQTPMAPPLQEVRLGGGRMAVLHFRGDYAGLHAAYAYLYGEWLPKSGEAASGAPPYEIYLNTPMDAAPEDLLTEVCLPLA